MCLTTRNALKANHCVLMDGDERILCYQGHGSVECDASYSYNKMKAKGGQHSIFFPKKKSSQNFLAQIHVSFDHIRKTMKVISTTSYPLSVAFIFSLLPMLMGAQIC